MYDNRPLIKVKNDNIERWLLELSAYSRHNLLAWKGRLDARYTHTVSAWYNKITRPTWFIVTPNLLEWPNMPEIRSLTYSIAEIKSTIAWCNVCAEIKPRFCQPPPKDLIRTTQPFERLSTDFNSLLPSTFRNRNILTSTDEYLRLPPVVICSDMHPSNITGCPSQFFIIYSTPSYIQSDQGINSKLAELSEYLRDRGAAFGHYLLKSNVWTTPSAGPSP